MAGAMRNLVDFDGGIIFLTDEQGAYLAASDPVVPEADPNLRIPIGTGVTGRIIASGEPIYIPDIREDRRVDSAAVAALQRGPFTSYLGVPLHVLGEVIGVPSGTLIAGLAGWALG